MRTIHDRYLKEDMSAGLYQIMAEIHEAEGNYAEASRLYQRAATFAANTGQLDRIPKLLEASRKAGELAYVIDNID